MKRKSGIVLMALAVMFIVGCSTASNLTPSQNTVDLQTLVSDLKAVAEGSLETKRTASVAILKNWLFDGGFWEVAFKTSRIRPSVEVTSSVQELTNLSIKYSQLKEGEKMSDYDLGKAMAYYAVVVYGIVDYGIQELTPQIVRLLTLF